uniref:Evasin n=1 Tax=Rhipicephalus appendiculatus TaxID=34631 RepID=A0A131Z3H6_RHIAP
MRTPAGRKIIGCVPICDHPNPMESQDPWAPKVKVNRPDQQCLTISPGAWKYIVAGINYTCELGKCNKNSECISFDLLIGCWRE